MLYTYVIRLQSKTSLYRVLRMTKVYMNAGKTEINIFKSQSRSFNPHDIKQINAVEQNNLKKDKKEGKVRTAHVFL